MYDHKKRWGIADEPNWQRFFRKREVTHPIITTWDEFSEVDKEILLEVKKVMVSFLGDCKVGVHGSRIKGYWHEDSDYDIKVFKIPNEETKAKIVNHIWKYRIDLAYLGIENYGLELVIEIP